MTSGKPAPLTDLVNSPVQADYAGDGSSEQFGDDAFGDLVMPISDTVTYSHGYTPRHALAPKTDSRFGRRLHWAHDAAGKLTRKTDYQGEVTTFQYDSTNHLVAMRNAEYLLPGCCAMPVAIKNYRHKTTRRAAVL